MIGDQWVWDEDESDGFNIACAFEITLLNFGIITEYEEQNVDVILRFSEKYGNRT